MQALVLGKGGQHGGLVAAKAGGQQHLPVRLAEVLQVGRRQHAQQRIAKPAAGELLRVVLDLVEQHRHQIDHTADLRMAFEVPGHVDVVLHGMQIDPGQHELRAGFGRRRSVSANSLRPCGSFQRRAMIAIVRLMHVPEKDQVELFHVLGGSARGRLRVSVQRTWLPD